MPARSLHSLGVCRIIISSANKKQIGFGRPMFTGARRLTASLCGFSLRVSAVYLMGGGCGTPKGVPYPVTRSTNPQTPARPLGRGLRCSKLVTGVLL